jgi:peptide subunit release factor 1 (eRF1)
MMQTAEVSPDRVRTLASRRAEHGKVLSIYLNLDPSQFGTAQARATEIRSLLDEAHRRVRERDGLSHEQLVTLRSEVQRAERFFAYEFTATGAHGLALFLCDELDLLEALPLPRPVESAVVVDEVPYVAPLLSETATAEWCVALVSRRSARILRGGEQRLLEVAQVRSNVHGWHDQGGWSQARYQRGIEEEAAAHLRRVTAELLRRYERRPFSRLVLGGPQELASAAEAALHPYLRARLAGWIHVDVEAATPEEVHAAVAEIVAADARQREDEALARLHEGLGAGSGATRGLEQTLAALVERRVETLLLADGYRAAGVRCGRCGWLGPAEHKRCPADGERLEQCEDITEQAVVAALGQDASVLTLRDRPELGPLGQIAAVLRY